MHGGYKIAFLGHIAVFILSFILIVSYNIIAESKAMILLQRPQTSNKP
jgi:hypothetical protein